ncbi:MAG: hypothetical protein WBQ25_02300 [Nitrososphaeraceae archaeon]
MDSTMFVFLIVLSLGSSKDIEYYEKQIEKLKRIGYKEPEWKYQTPTNRSKKRKDGICPDMVMSG